MSATGIGVGIGVSPASVSAAPPAENLLRWTDSFSNAVWTYASASVAAGAGSGGSDRITNASPSGAVRQVSETAASAGAAVVASIETSAGWVRNHVTGSFDGQDYVFSVEVMDATGGGIPALRLRLDRSGGAIRCSIEDAGDEAVYDVRRAQLETGSSPTAYVARTT